MRKAATKTIFVSHLSEEATLAALLQAAIAHDFQNHAAVFVSSDIGSIELGTDWMDAIERAINRSSLLVLLCSHASIQKPWVNFELGLAWMRKIPIVPVCHTGLSPKDLPMPLIAKEGIEASSEQGLQRLYEGIARQLPVPTPKGGLHALAQKVIQFETVYAKSRLQPPKQFEYHIDLLLQPPGKLEKELIPLDTPVESDAKTLKLFGLLEGRDRTWGDLERAANRGRDTRWVKQLQNCVYLASNDLDFNPVQTIFHTHLGSYQPDLARLEIMPNGGRRFHIHFVNTVVLPLAEVPNQFGTLATLLRLGLRFRYEVIEKYEDVVKRATSLTEPQKDRENLLRQVRAAIETIECDAYSRGAEHLDEESVVALFELETEQQQIRDISRRWEHIRARFFNSKDEPGIEEARNLFDELRSINFDFIVLGTRQFNDWVRRTWARRVTRRARHLREHQVHEARQNLM